MLSVYAVDEQDCTVKKAKMAFSLNESMAK